MVTSSSPERRDRPGGGSTRPSRLVVKARRPVLVRWAAPAAGLVIVLAVAAAAFEAGRRLGQGEWRQGRQDLRALAALAAKRESENEVLRREVAAITTARGVEQRAQDETRRMLVDLEREVQRQREELDFYRTIVSPEDGVAGLRIQDLRVRRGRSERHFLLELVLVQAAKHDKPVAGVVEFRVEGVQDGEPRSLAASEVATSPTGARTLPFSFRYFTDLEQGIELPPDFEPDRVEVTVTPDGNTGQTLRQTYDWAAIS